MLVDISRNDMIEKDTAYKYKYSALGGSCQPLSTSDISHSRSPYHRQPLVISAAPSRFVYPVEIRCFGRRGANVEFAASQLSNQKS